MPRSCAGSSSAIRPRGPTCEKREHYQQITSLHTYVVVAQDRRCVECWQRRDDGAWAHRVLTPGDTIDLAPVRCQVTVDELYAEAGLA